MIDRHRVRVAAGVAFAGIALAPLAACAGSTQDAAAPTFDGASAPARCADLAGTRVDGGVIEGAERVSAGEAFVGGETAGATASANLCHVRMRLQPVTGSDIRMEVWLPDSWNNKLMGFGGAGFDGGLNLGGAPLFNKALGEGYAVVANDAGHKPDPTSPLQSWVHKQPQKVVDFGHRANHVAAAAARQVIDAYYGAPAERAYFIGCSNGGRDGVMLASRYPEDYDGIVAGAPALNYLETVTQLIFYSEATHDSGGTSLIGAKHALVHEAILKSCDELDGVKDGVLETPPQCRFDFESLKCGGPDASTCLTDAQVAAFRKIHGGLRTEDGQLVFSGPALGATGSPDWDGWVNTPQGRMIGEEFYRWLVFDDPNWKIGTFDFDRDYAIARERIAPIINAADPDLSAFTRRGGKLIIYQGWDDPAITPASTIRYYEDVRRTLGSRAADHVRLFMVPGMGHCAGGPGTDNFDMQDVLERWVEQGEAPERVVASKRTDPSFTRPLCLWPNTAHYNGSGSISDAANFTCKALS